MIQVLATVHKTLFLWVCSRWDRVKGTDGRDVGMKEKKKKKKKRLYLLTVYSFPFCLSVCLHHTLYIICTYMCVYMHACVCMYVHLESEVNTRYSPILISTLLSEAGFLIEPGVHQF